MSQPFAQDGLTLGQKNADSLSRSAHGIAKEILSPGTCFNISRGTSAGPPIVGPIKIDSSVATTACLALGCSFIPQDKDPKDEENSVKSMASTIRENLSEGNGPIPLGTAPVAPAHAAAA